MSYHYSPEDAAECSAPSCFDGGPSDTSRSTTTPSASCAPASTTDTYPPPPYSAMSVHSSVTGTPQHIRDWLTSLLPVSPASPSASQASEPEPTTAATCGPKPSQPSAWYDRTTACWRTFQGSLLADTLEPFSATWPKAGTTRAGVFYRQPNWERRIDEIGSGLWPSPKALDRFGIETSPQNHAKYGTGMTLTQAARRSMWPTMTVADATGGRTSKGSQRPDEFGRAKAVKMSATDGTRSGTITDNMTGTSLAQQVKTPQAFPTPNASPWRSGKGRQENGHAPQLPEVIGGQLNPTWVEWLMGWPLGWTDLRPLATDRFRQWCEQHGSC